tara:strand:- start:926 stop:1156 length:231 start_codon:yes stop_codon:yes gene_type:complete
MIKNIIFIIFLNLWGVGTYFAYKAIDQQNKEFWKSAYHLGYEQGYLVAKHQYRLTRDQMASRCMFFDYGDQNPKKP